jgi:hypothetical protein
MAFPHLRIERVHRSTVAGLSPGCACFLLFVASLSAGCTFLDRHTQSLFVVVLGQSRPVVKTEALSLAIENRGRRSSPRYRGCSVSVWAPFPRKENAWEIHACYGQSAEATTRLLCGPDRPPTGGLVPISCPSVIEPGQRFAWRIRLNPRFPPGPYKPVVTLWHADRAESDIIEGELLQTN